MPFISVFYLLFLALVAIVYYLLSRRPRMVLLLCASYFFYLTWQPAFLMVLCCITLIGFQSAKMIASVADKKAKKQLLFWSVMILLLPLVFFKYFNFLNETLSKVFGIFAIEIPILTQPYLVPLGISFFTFQAISYVADVYRGYLNPEKRIENFALYMAFFPTLLAGPIERAKTFLSQIHVPVSIDYHNIRAGMQLILWGVFKKVVLADRMMDFIGKVYSQPQDFQGIFIYMTIVFSSFQLFCDFSAYSDIAVGTARIFGINLMKNFDDRVYAAPSREIFWKGWHRSLTSWLRDYVFFPLSKGVRSRYGLYINLMIVYFLVGLWHGASWGFILWGLFNGIWLVAEHVSKNGRRKLFMGLGINIHSNIHYFLSWLLVFHAGALFGIFFRTDTPQDAFDFISNLSNSNTNWFSGWESKTCFVTILLLLLMDWINRRIPKNENFDKFIEQKRTWFRWIVYILLTELILRSIFIFGNENFMYFKF